MTQTIAFLGSSSQVSVAQLQTLEQKLQGASRIEDVRQSRSQIGECVAMIRSETTRVQTESKARIASLQEEIARLSSGAPARSTGEAIDSVTGLPARTLAEEAIAAKSSPERMPSQRCSWLIGWPRSTDGLGVWPETRY